MNKVAIVYWSGTGNTEAMANHIAEGVRTAGGEAELITSDNFTAERLSAFDAAAFGCPAMGDEVLEESEFDPMFTALEGSLDGKNIALFGSYGWGDGEWMRNWCSRCEKLGANLLDKEGLIVNEAPDAEGKKPAGRWAEIWPHGNAEFA